MSASRPSGRRRSREFVLQALYQWQLAGQAVGEIDKQYREAEDFAKADAPFFSFVLQGAIDQAPVLRELLQPHLDRPWGEVSPIERAILLLAAFELRAAPDVPYRVVINEAIELAKSYGGTDGHKYINGVLDKLAAILRSAEAALPAARTRGNTGKRSR